MGARATPTGSEQLDHPKGSGLRRFDPRTLRSADIRVFSSESNAPLARRPSDAVLLILALIGLMILFVPAPGPGAIDQAVETLVKDLPGLFGWAWEIAYDGLILWALVIVVLSCVAHDRTRLIVSEVLAAALGFGMAALAGLASGTTMSDILHGVTATTPPAVYPAVRLALAASLIVTASPHLSRPLRYFGRWVIAAGTLASIALGIALPVGVAAGLAAGVATGALVHLILGSPGGRPSALQITAALADLGVTAIDVRPAPIETSDVALALATSEDGHPLLVKIYGRDALEGQFVSSLWASLRNKGETPSLGGRAKRVEHEAFVTLLAERAGVSVLPVVTAGMAQERDAVVAIDTQGSRPLSTLTDGEIDDELLRRLWEALTGLGDLGIAHGAVDGDRLAVRPDGTAAIGDFGDATVPAAAADIQADRARLLVTTALLTTRERALMAARSVLGSDGLADLLPYVQPAVVDGATRREIRSRGWKLDDLRDAAAEEAGTEVPPLEQLRRVTVGSILTVVILALVAYALISAITNVGLQSLIDEFQSADMTWLLAALAVVPVVGVAQAVSTMGASIRPVRFGPVVMLQYGVAFVALAVPSSAARVALEVRFFEKFGVPGAGALAIGVIDSVSGFVIQMMVILTVTLSGLATLSLSSLGSGDSSGPTFTGKYLIVGVVLLAIAIVLAVAVPKLRAMVRKAREAAKAQMAEGAAALRVFRTPSKVAMIFIGNLTAQVLYAGILGMCLHAFGYQESFANLILVNTLVSLFAGFMPVPGGMGVAEAGYTAGLVALGVPHTAALSTAIAFRLVTYYLPPIWGGFAMRWMRQHSYI